jgi:SAM-dependent methyltransferase
MATSRFEERNMAIKNFNSQFAHPKGWFGGFVGMILTLKNRERNAWTISMLNIQPDDQVLEIGFGPGQALQEVAKLAPNGFVAGIDLSDEMVAQASKRNAVAIRSGRVLLQQGSEAPLPFEDSKFNKAFAVNSIQTDRFQTSPSGDKADQTNHDCEWDWYKVNQRSNNSILRLNLA